MCFMNDFVDSVQERVAYFRNQGESMESIAQRAGITRVYLYGILSRHNNPSIEVVSKVAEGLGIKISVKSP